MPAVSVLLKCNCTAQFELALDGEETAATLHNRLRKDIEVWEAAHATCRQLPPPRPALGFQTTHAVSSERAYGEGHGEWDGMYASPSEDDDDD